MFRRVNLKEQHQHENYYLMQTGKIKCAKIPIDYIESITYSTDELSKMTLKIPNLIYNVEKDLIDNPLYYNFRGKGQQIVVESEKSPEDNARYIITTMSVEEESYELDDGEYRAYSIKEITAESYESIIKENQFIITEDLVRCLYTNEETSKEDGEISKGMLNLFEEDNPLFTIGYVSDDCRKEFNKVEEVYSSNILKDLKIKLDRSKNVVLFDKPISTTREGNNVLNFKINYDRFSCTDLITGKSVKTNTWSHNINNIYTNVTNIKATYTETSDIKYCIKYDLTLDNGDILTRYVEVDYMDKMETTFPSIDLDYTNGTTVERYFLKYCNFEAGTFNWYDFLMNNIALAYDCTFVFDSYNKILNCYSLKELGERKGIKLSYKNFVKKVNKTNRFEDIVTKLYVFSDNTSIIDENKFGNCEYILNYDYFYNNDIMTEELKNAWDRYIANLDNHQVDLTELRIEQNTNNKTILLLESENVELDYNIKGLQLRRTDYIKRNKDGTFDGDIARLTEEIERRQKRFESNLKEIQTAKDSNQQIIMKLTELTKQSDFKLAQDEQGLIFTKELIEELMEITYTKELNDTNYLTPYALYNNYVEVLKEKNKLGIDFTIDLVGLLENIVIPKGLTWNYYIGLWDIFEFEDEDINTNSDIKDGIRLTGYTYSPKNFTLSGYKFSNKNKNKDDYELASNIGSSIKRSNNYVVNYNQLWKESGNVNSYYKTLTTEGMDLKASMIKSRGGRVKLDFTEAGMYVIDAENEDCQAYLGASMYCITRDRWHTCATAIDENGIVGKEIIGQLLLGEKLGIVAEDYGFWLGTINDKHDLDEKGKHFGMVISDYDADNNATSERIFLGLEKQSDNSTKAKFMLRGGEHGEMNLNDTSLTFSEYDKVGNKLFDRIFLGLEKQVDNSTKAKFMLRGKNGALNISEEGLLQTMNKGDVRELDSTHPLTCRFYLDEGVARVDVAKLLVNCEKFRSTTRGGEFISNVYTTDSGGGKTSGGGGGETTTENGSHRHGMFVHTPIEGTGVPLDKPKGYLASSLNGFVAVGMYAPDGAVKDVLYTYQSNGSHTHRTAHHSHWCPDHQHRTNISHKHSEIWGITENTSASNVEVLVNGQRVRSGINGTGNELDIKPYVKTGQWNTITFKSFTNGAIAWDLYIKSFNLF